MHSTLDGDHGNIFSSFASFKAATVAQCFPFPVRGLLIELCVLIYHFYKVL